MSTDSVHIDAPLEWKPKHNPWIIAAAVILPTFLEVLDTTIVTVALNHIAGNLSSTYEEATWVVTSYLVANAIVLPASSWLSCLFGRKLFLQLCIIIFTTTSFLCGQAGSLNFLILMRVLQGAGGGALQPLSQAILMESFPPAKRGMAMAAFGLGVVVAPVIGPTMGGWLTDNYSWPWIFFINIPFGILAVFLIQRFVEDPPYIAAAKPGKIDSFGFGLLALWLGTLQVVLDKGQIEDWFASDYIVRLTAISAVSFIVLIWWELRVDEPIINLRIFQNRNFTLGTMLVGIIGVTMYATLTVQPMFLQSLLGYNAYNTGLSVSARGITALFSMPICGIALKFIDPRLLIAFGFFTFSGSSYLFHLMVNLDVGMGTLIIPNLIQGFGMSFMFIPISMVAMGLLRQEQMGNASGLFNLSRNLGGSVGIAMITTFISRNAQIQQADLVQNLSPYNPVYVSWLAQIKHSLAFAVGPANSEPIAQKALYGILVQQSALMAFSQAFFLLAALALTCLFCIPLLRKVRGDVAVSAH